MPFRNLGRTLNRQTHNFVNWITGKVQGTLQGAWRENELRLSGAPSHAFFEGYDPRGSEVPRLHGYSRHLVPKPSDWGAREHITGYWFLQRQTDWQPPRELAAFLEAGPPPVYVGFGSMPAEDAQAQTAIVAEAIKRSGQRALLATGWGGLTGADLGSRVHVIEHAPHGWLFPRCAAVVHHGGAGTTHEGLRWGMPSIVCPVGVDQPFWGRRVNELGAGPPPILQKHLDAETLTAALEAVKNPAMTMRAEQAGAAMRAEGGAAEAAAVIGRFADETRASGTIEAAS